MWSQKDLKFLYCSGQKLILCRPSRQPAIGSTHVTKDCWGNLTSEQVIGRTNVHTKLPVQALIKKYFKYTTSMSVDTYDVQSSCFEFRARSDATPHCCACARKVGTYSCNCRQQLEELKFCTSVLNQKAFKANSHSWLAEAAAWTSQRSSTREKNG